jgi:hypothetical protein
MVVKHFPMAHARAAIAADPRLFGRGRPREPGMPKIESWTLSDDARLFAMTFVAGFLFVSILIA